MEDLPAGQIEGRSSGRWRVTILLLTQVFPPAQGGSGRWLWELYRRLHAFDVHVAAGHAPGSESFDKISDLPITRLPLSFSNWGVWDLRSAVQYARALIDLKPLVSRPRPDAIHCGKCLPEGLLATVFKRWRGIPFYCFVHGEELTLASTSKELTRLSRKVLREATGVIANSHHTKQIVKNHWHVAEDRLVVMHPGVDTERFRPAPIDPAIRSRLGWADRRVILTVGALQKRKGQDMLIRALPAIRVRCPDVLYSIIGEGWERPYLDRLVAEHDVVDLVQFRMTPADEELIECYQQCDVFALPNRQVGWDFEGFGIVLLEAQACGKPVIAGLSGGTAETMEPSRTGELVACDTPDRLAEAAVDLLEHPERRAQMGACARQWVVDHFDWRVLSEQARRFFTAASAEAV
jgi:phosphatidylinositol alpha-1,6-mannosyltransferase